MDIANLKKAIPTVSVPKFFSIKLPGLAFLFATIVFALYFVSTKFILFFGALALAAFMAVPFFGSIQGLLIWASFLAFFGISMLTHYTGINPIITSFIAFILLTSITVKINGVEYTKALLPKFARRIVLLALILATYYYLHTVKGWGAAHFVALAIPTILLKFVNIYDIMDEGKDWHDNYNTFSG